MRYFIAGDPVPQGSLNFYHGRAVHSNQKYLHPWREKIANEIGQHVSVNEGPFEIELAFTLRRPRTVTREAATVRPDLDKLVRAVLDALTRVAYQDDSQVVRLVAEKSYGSEPGVFIKIRALMGYERG